MLSQAVLQNLKNHQIMDILDPLKLVAQVVDVYSGNVFYNLEVIANEYIY
jgi:hypothetical protein